MKKLMISLSVAVFALAMMANIQYALDGYGVNNSNLHAQVLAQSTGTGGTTNGGGSGSGNWYTNTDFFAHMETIPIYNHNLNFAAGYKVFKLEIGNYQAGFLGYIKCCEACSNIFHTCDLTREGFYSVNAGTSSN